MRKVTRVMFYQGFQFDGATIRSYATDDFYSDSTLKKNHKAVEEEKGILLISKREVLLIPWNNVAAVYFDFESAKPADTSKPKAPKA